MDKFMHVPPEKVCVAVEPENAQGRGVGKGAVTVEIDPVYALSSRIQQKLSNLTRVIEETGHSGPLLAGKSIFAGRKPAIMMSN